ncbi:MAG: PLDc N-terminal domain-containing protein [Gemmataceae bacterium]
MLRLSILCAFASCAMLFTQGQLIGQVKNGVGDKNTDTKSTDPVKATKATADTTPAGCAGCGVCGGSMIVIVLVPILIFVLNIVLLIWVARDAKSRNMDSSVLWMALVFFTGLLGLVIYLFSRPKGDLYECRSCGNKRLVASKRCPHCGNLKGRSNRDDDDDE